jgi:hypothetical protein
MRSFLGIGLLVGLFVSFSGTVSAGDFGMPIQPNACGEMDIAEDAMVDPTTAFVFAETPELCQKMCKRGAKLCHVFVNDVIACFLRGAAANRAFLKLNCESINDDPASVKACKQDVAELAAIGIAQIKAERPFQHDDCEEWGAICIDSCAAP